MPHAAEEESPAVITRSQSHKELASPVARGLGPASPDLIIPGVHNLRESIPEETCASVSSPAAGATFRKRRLTMADSKSPATFESVAFPRRATIFASSEIGEISEVPPPFPTDILGTYSCHGIEPVYGDDDEEVGVAKKINQDRGCVVYPFNRSRAQALFMVMDGHGSDGNLVSEHVMRKVRWCVSLRC